MWRYKILVCALLFAACAPFEEPPPTQVINLQNLVFTPTGGFTPTHTPLVVTATPAPPRLLQTVSAAPPLVSATRTPVIPPTLTETATPKGPPTVPTTPTATPTFPPTLTPTIPFSLTPFCQEPGGLVIPENVQSTILGYKVAMRVYLPPCYKDYPERRFPVLYLIHGLNQNERSWNEVGADKTAATLIASGKIPPFIMVMPEERAQQDNEKEFGKVFVTEIVPYIDANYRTINDRKYRAIGGLSRGGGWTINIGLQNPEKFGALGLHSPAIFYGDDTKLSTWIKNVPPNLMPRIYLDVGEDDILLESVKWVHNVFLTGGARHDYFINKGTHIISYWRDQLPNYLKWYTANW